MEQLDRVALSKVRLERAQEFLKAAIDNAKLGDYLTSANRSYYAVYLAIRALLTLEYSEMAKHSGNISEFRRLYIKTGIFRTEFSGYISALFQIRNDSDYDPVFTIAEVEVMTQLEHAKEMVSAIADYLTSCYNDSSC
jgi:uncharacterized protein (UPF0332 family)